MAKRISFEEACRTYVHRFTMEHVPAWAASERPGGTYYAPQYRSDREWYDCTKFPGEKGLPGNSRHCESGKPTWPLGMFLTQPYKRS